MDYFCMGANKVYLENDFYLSEYRKDLKSDKEVYAFLKKCFPNLNFLPVKGSYLSAELCLLTYLLYCYSTSELSGMLGNFFSQGSVRTRIAELIKKEDASIDDLKMPRRDMGAIKAYCLTKSGYASYLGSIPDELKPSGGQLMVRRSKGMVPLHDYGVGISLLSFMLLGIPFYFGRKKHIPFGM